MSRNRTSFAKLFDNMVKSLKPHKEKRKLVGTDNLGNSYYEVFPTEHSSRTRPSRYFVPKDQNETKFDNPLPAEWEAWLRLRRQEPPSNDEIKRNLELMNTKKINAAILDKQFSVTDVDSTSTEAQGDQVVTGVKNFPLYNDYEMYPGKKPKNE